MCGSPPRIDSLPKPTQDTTRRNSDPTDRGLESRLHPAIEVRAPVSAPVTHSSYRAPTRQGVYPGRTCEPQEGSQKRTDNNSAHTHTHTRPRAHVRRDTGRQTWDNRRGSSDTTLKRVSHVGADGVKVVDGSDSAVPARHYPGDRGATGPTSQT